jgi:hypothetical protein
LPEGERHDLRDCGIATLPLAQLNAVLAPLGYVIRGTKTRLADRFGLCLDAQGGIERYGLFALQRLWQACRMTPQAEQARQHARAAQSTQRATHTGPLKGAL